MSSSIVVLAGAGHANIQCLKMFAMNPVEGVEVILISEGDGSPYSGMLPGYLMGMYSEEQIQFNLWKLTSQAKVTFLKDKISRIDPQSQTLYFESGRTPVEYDVLSLNLGITPKLDLTYEESDSITPLKPISKLVEVWKKFLEKSQNQKQIKVAVVGGGAAGVETCVALSVRLNNMKMPHQIALYQKANQLMPGAPQQLSKKIEELLAKQNISVYLNCPITPSPGGKLTHKAKIEEKFDHVFLATTARSPSLFRDSKFSTDAEGFLKVNKHLQSLDFPSVFGAGDCIQFDNMELPKAGVFAVREAKVLYYNLKQFAKNPKNAKLKKYSPQKNFLRLIHVGPSQVLAFRKNAFFVSYFFLWLKKLIDLKFMKKFGNIPSDMQAAATTMGSEQKNKEKNLCGGCGAKIEKVLLSEALSQVKLLYTHELPQATEDCESIGADSKLYASIDGLKNFVNDPFIFGKVSSLHALSDLWVSGIEPISMMVSIGLQQRQNSLQKLFLSQAMGGILSVCHEQNIKMINAHSFETQEDQLSISVIGKHNDLLFRKSGAMEGDLIVLSKPLGVGVALQSLMRHDVPLKTLNGLLKGLLQANRLPSEIRPYIHAATDVTGFGLLGHLSEILVASNKAATIYSASLPLLPQIEELLARGNRSYLIDKNKNAYSAYLEGNCSEIVFDPQTNGPILAIIDSSKADFIPKSWQIIGRIDRLSENLNKKLVQFI